MFNPDDFWQFAVSLLAQQDAPEGHCRTAASRAYYAFFLTIRDRLAGFHLRHDASDHGRVLEELRRRNRSALAAALRDLRQLRDLADYDTANPVTCLQVLGMMTRNESAYQNAKLIR